MNTSSQSFEQALKQALRVEPAPAALRQSLLTAARSQRRPGWLYRGLLAAAACLLLVFGGLGYGIALADPAPRLARQAFEEYRLGHKLAFTGRPDPNCSCGDSCHCCAQWSQTAVGFPAKLPEHFSCACIEGGRSCRLSRQPVAVYQLDHQQTIYVFPKPIRRQEVKPGKPIAVSQSMQARLWNEGGRGYLLLERTDR